MDESPAIPTEDQVGNQDIGVAIWLRATPKDLIDLDFETPLKGSVDAECREISQRYWDAAQAISQSSKSEDLASSRVWNLLNAVTGMYFKPENPNGFQVACGNACRSSWPFNESGASRSIVGSLLAS